MTRRRNKVWQCAECSKVHPRHESLHIDIRRHKYSGEQPLQLCSFECTAVLRIRIGLLAQPLVPVHARKDGRYVEVSSPHAKVRLQYVVEWRARHPAASFRDLLLTGTP